MIKILNNKNRLFIFWNIGKKVFLNQNKYSNSIKKYSEYYQYYFGVTDCFDRINIYSMQQFYLCFPIFYDKLNSLKWEYYLELIKVDSKWERMFYFQLALFTQCDYQNFVLAIKNDLYFQLKKR